MPDDKMTFDEVLTRWNNGINTGAQLRLAKELAVTQATISRWVSGDSRPAEKMRAQVAKILNISVQKLNASLDETIKRIRDINIARNKEYAVEKTVDLMIARFEALKRLLDKKIISQSEYEEKRRKLLDSL